MGGGGVWVLEGERGGTGTNKKIQHQIQLIVPGFTAGQGSIMYLFLLAHLSIKCLVSYCDQSMSVIPCSSCLVHCPKCDVNNLL